jgi:hypothetical protein
LKKRKKKIIRYVDTEFPEELQEKIAEAANSVEQQKLITEYENAKYDEAYATLDEYYRKTHEIQARAKEFNNLEMLFDMAMSNYRSLKESLDDLVQLKGIWDAIVLVKSTFKDWNSILKVNRSNCVVTASRTSELEVYLRMGNQ